MPEIAALTAFLKAELRRDRREARVVRVVASAAVLALLTVAIISLVSVLSVLGSIEAQTSPKRVHENQLALARIEADVVLCVANHDDRILAAAFHHPVPARRQGCPVDPAA